MKSLSKIYILFFLLVLPLGIIAQGNDVSFQAYSTAKQVLLGNYFEVSFVVNNSSGTNFKPPAFKNFKLMSGQNVSSSTNITNGSISRSTTYSYYIQPKKKGKLTIEPASINIGGKTFKTKPIIVEVLESKKGQKSIDNKQEVFIKAEVSDSIVVPGQQVTLDYRVYFSTEVDHYGIVEEPTYDGFFVSTIRRYNGLTEQVVINGKQYHSKIIKRMALYPQQTGTLTIDPMTFRVALPIEGQPSRKNVFSLIRPTRSEIINTNPLDIQVKSLPRPIPESFSGAVGNHYMATAILDKTEASTDEAITLKLTITGNGDIKRVTAPKLVVSDTFEVYDPNLIEEDKGENYGELYGKKTFEYLILPKVPGQYSLRPEFSYYNPDSSKFIIDYPATFQVNIRQGKHNANVNVKPVEPKKVERDIRYIKTQIRTQKKSHFVGTFGFWLLVSLPFMILIGASLYKYWLSTRPEIDPIAEKSRKAKKVAKQKLAIAEKYLKEGNHRSFYDETSKALLGYVIDKFNIPGSELSKNNVQEKLIQSGANQEHISRFMELIQTCEKAVFAFGTNADASKTYQEAIDVITDIGIG